MSNNQLIGVLTDWLAAMVVPPTLELLMPLVPYKVQDGEGELLAYCNSSSLLSLPFFMSPFKKCWALTYVQSATTRPAPLQSLAMTPDPWAASLCGWPLPVRAAAAAVLAPAMEATIRLEP